MKDTPQQAAAAAAAAGTASRSAQGLQSESALVNSLQSGSSSECADAPARGKKRKGCICVILTLLVLIIVGVRVRHHTRGRQLGAFLAEVEKAHTCFQPQTGTCATLLSAIDDSKFDLQPGESTLIGFIFEQLFSGSGSELGDVLCGGHVLIPDSDGFAYVFLTSLPGARQRISSHQSDRAQYGIDEGAVISELLIGRLGNNTWFQLEGAAWNPFHKPWASLKHSLDFIEYMAGLRRFNIGPQGVSVHTDKKPLVVGGIIPAKEVCATACPAAPMLVELHGVDRQDTSEKASSVAATSDSKVDYVAQGQLRDDDHNGGGGGTGFRNRISLRPTFLGVAADQRFGVAA